VLVGAVEELGHGAARVGVGGWLERGSSRAELTAFSIVVSRSRAMRCVRVRVYWMGDPFPDDEDN